MNDTLVLNKKYVFLYFEPDLKEIRFLFCYSENRSL